MARNRKSSTEVAAEGGTALAQPPLDLPAGEAEHAFRARKLAVGEQAPPAEEPRTIPWSYGEDRVTAMAVDPSRMFVYWEVTDGAIARARQGLGPGGPDAWLNLRVYDASGRLFDGTNAHSYFDHRIGREDRQYFFDIGKPASEAFVEVGLLSHEGFFVKIARSGRVSFPRHEPTVSADPQWMTVRVQTGEVMGGGDGWRHGAHTGHESRPAERSGHRQEQGHGHGPPGPPGEWSQFEPVPLWRMHLSWEELVRAGLEFGDRTAWEQILREGWFEGRRTMSWEGPAMITSWAAGPFTYPVEVDTPTTDFFTGPARRYEVGGRTHLVYGPWQVVIRGLGAHRSGQILQRWEIHRTWIASEGHAVRVVGLSPYGMRPGASEQMVGASEWRWLAASEQRLAGASEVYYLGASERRLLGASETLFQAASEWLLRGASERRFLGASEVRLAGASEQVLRGASERVGRGASERLLAGAGERLGASEGRLAGAGEGLYPPPPRRD